MSFCAEPVRSELHVFAASHHLVNIVWSLGNEYDYQDVERGPQGSPYASKVCGAPTGTAAC